MTEPKLDAVSSIPPLYSYDIEAESYSLVVLLLNVMSKIVLHDFKKINYPTLFKNMPLTYHRYVH